MISINKFFGSTKLWTYAPYKQSIIKLFEMITSFQKNYDYSYPTVDSIRKRMKSIVLNKVAPVVEDTMNKIINDNFEE